MVNTAKHNMNKAELKALELRARTKINNNELAGIFRKADSAYNGYDLSGELYMTGSNEEVISKLKYIAFKTNGIYETVGEYIVVTTPNFQHIGKLIS